MKKCLVIIALTIGLSSIVSAQNKAAFESNLSEANNYFELMTTINDEYNLLPQNIRERGGDGYLKEKHWRRWQWWAESHLGANGSFVNVNKKTLEGIKKMQSMVDVEKSTNSSWAQVGPTVSSYQNVNAYCALNGLGRIDRIAFHPTDADIIYAGAPAGGLWKTTDGGTSWTSLNQFTPSLGISGIVVDHSDPDILYVLTGDGDSNIPFGFVAGMDYIRASVGVMKSEDAGLTWQLTGTLSTNEYYGLQLAMDPNDSDILLAATSDGLWRTDDGGDSWTEVQTGKVYDVKFKPFSSTRLYCTTDNNIKYSNNGGTSWFNASVTNAPVAGRKTIAVSNDNVNAVYVLCGSNTNLTANTFAGFYRSSNSGLTYGRQSNTPNILDDADDGSGAGNASIYILGLAVSHADEDIALACSLIGFKSTDKGVTWNNNTTYWEDGTPWYVHPDLHDIKYNPLDDKAYLAGDGGIYVSSDDGDSWTDITSNINVNQTYHIDQYPGSVRILTGHQDNGLKYRMSGGDFEHIHSGDGFNPEFFPDDNSKYYSTINDRLYRFSNSGSTRSLDLSPVSNVFFQTLAVHNTDDDIMFCGNTDIYKSENQGSSFSNKGASGSWALSSCPSNNSKFYATGFTSFNSNSSGKAYMSDDIGETWNDLSSNSGFPSTVWKLTDISPRPNNSNQVYLTCGGYNAGSKVYYSSDSGTTWTNISGSLPDVPVHCVAVSNNNDVYIGTDIGVFYKSASMTDWIPFSNGLPNVPVTDIRLDHNVGNGNIYIATFGRGVWWDNISDNTCDTDITLSGNYDGYNYYEASNTIESTADVSGTIGNQLYFSAGHSVNLKPGFKASENSKFKAYIAPCGDGVPNVNDDDTSVSQKNLNSESGQGKKFNSSKFNITNDHIELAIKEAGTYSLELLDFKFGSIQVLDVFNAEAGEQILDKSLIPELDAPTQLYVGIFSSNTLIYLQEIN